MKILTIDSEGDGGFSLPIFSFTEEVETFLYHFEEQKQMTWRASARSSDIFGKG
jgi:hypothetical protein